MHIIAKGSVMTVRHALLGSPLGPLTLSADSEGLRGIYFAGHRHPPRQDSLGEQVQVAVDPLLSQVAGQLAEYFDRARTSFDLPLTPVGPAFHQRVWDRLRAIDYGERMTYGAIATELGDPRLARAVGAAVGRNPISIVVPCHRVVGSTGRLTGFAGGLDRKAWLLALEGADEPALF